MATEAEVAATEAVAPCVQVNTVKKKLGTTSYSQFELHMTKEQDTAQAKYEPENVDKTIDELTKNLSAEELKVIRETIHGAGGAPGSEETVDPDEDPKMYLRPVDLQEKIAMTDACVTLAEIHDANRKNLLLTRNQHVSNLISTQMSKPLKPINEAATKETLKALNPDVDPQKLMECILTSFTPKKPPGNTSEVPSTTSGELQRDVLHSKLQELLNSRAGLMQNAQLVALNENVTRIRGDLPPDTNFALMPPNKAQEVINREVAFQLQKAAEEQKQKTSADMVDNTESSGLQSNAFFEIGVTRAMQNLQTAGFRSDQLSEAPVQVPAPLMLSLGLVTPPTMSEADTGPPDHQPGAPYHTAFPNTASCNPVNKERIIDPAFAEIHHKHVSDVEIEYDENGARKIRRIEVIEIRSNPSVFVLPRFLLPSECALLLRLAETRWQQASAEVRFARLGIGAEQDDDGDWNFVGRVRRRCACVFQAEEERVESLAVVCYPPELTIHGQHDGASRKKTLHVFLNDVSGGGETDFPSLGFQLRPDLGTAVTFSNVNEDGSIDTRVTQSSLAPKSNKYILVAFLKTEIVHTVP